MPTIRIDDELDLYYEEQGAGRTIVFVHGVWMSGRYFRRQLEMLSQNHHVIAIDLRGHGRSSHSQSGHTMATYAQDLHTFLKAKELEDVVLCGWSMGCMVVWEYFEQFGNDRVAATILIDQSPSDFKWPDWELGVFDLPSLVSLMSDVQTDREAVFRHFIPMLFKEPPAQEDFDWLLEECMRMPATIASAVMFDQTMQDYRTRVSAVNVPTLVMTGGCEGKLLPVESVKFVHDNIPGSQFSVYENSNHCPFLEETERFNQEVEKFVGAIG